MENELLNRILAEEDFGKGLIELPEGTAVPEGKVVYFSTRDQKYGAGIMQGTVVYICNQELSRSDDGRYYQNSKCKSIEIFMLSVFKCIITSLHWNKTFNNA